MLLDGKFLSQANVERSGNSDVDVTVIVDTSALAYVLACFMYIDGRINQEQYEKMLKEIEKLRDISRLKDSNTFRPKEKQRKTNPLRARTKRV